MPRDLEPPRHTTPNTKLAAVTADDVAAARDRLHRVAPRLAKILDAEEIERDNGGNSGER